MKTRHKLCLEKTAMNWSIALPPPAPRSLLLYFIVAPRRLPRSIPQQSPWAPAFH